MDLEAELAAFSAEIGSLEEKAAKVVEATATAPATATSTATTAPSTTHDSRKRKAPLDGTNGSTLKRPTYSHSPAPSPSASPSTSQSVSASPAPSRTSASASPTKAPGPAIVAAAAAPAVQTQSAYSNVLAADRAALLAKQQQQHRHPRHAAGSADTAASSSAATAAASHHPTPSPSPPPTPATTTAISTLTSAASASTGGTNYVPGQVVNGYVASFDPLTGAPAWLPATEEQIEAWQAVEANMRLEEIERARKEKEAKKLAKKEAKAAAKAAKDSSVASAGGTDGSTASAASAASSTQTGEKHHLRSAAGKVWDDPTLCDWPENDYRIFCGDLGNEVTDAMLSLPFQRWPSFAKARVVRDKRSGKTKGFGFVSFLDPMEAIEALKEVNGKYIGNRPVRLRKSEWTKREAAKEKSWAAAHAYAGNNVRGNRKLHLY